MKCIHGICILGLNHLSDELQVTMLSRLPLWYPSNEFRSSSSWWYSVLADHISIQWLNSLLMCDYKLDGLTCMWSMLHFHLVLWFCNVHLSCSIFSKLINSSIPNTVDERAINKGKLSIYTIHENQTLALNSASSIGCNIVNIGPENLVEGKSHQVCSGKWSGWGDHVMSCGLVLDSISPIFVVWQLCTLPIIIVIKGLVKYAYPSWQSYALLVT